MVPDLVRVLAAAEEVGAGPDIGKMIGQLLQYGVVGLIVVLLILGVLVPKWAMNNLIADKDGWRAAYETERDAHQATRQQLAAAQASAEVATEQGQAMVRLLEEFGHRPQTAPRSA
ncbi:hypothetical protein ACLQ2J_12645 [Streptomyces cyaneofuscatus]|uniref:hypothetical protein n=1 Tax=Streptomyces cyaneofuscatus TaxID=66883 RepID=UPI003CF9C42B